MRTSARSLWLWLVAASLCSLWLTSAASAVTIDWVAVGAPLNACDVQGSNCFGTVASAYQISKYEVTNADYAAFLNAKAGALDPLALYNANMDPAAGQNGGIGLIGGVYTADPLRANMPVNWVSFYDTLRFSNWLNNGGLVTSDTESGAYLLLGGTETPTNGPIVTRSVGATIFLTSEDEWYKAAYYDTGSASYNTDPFADGFAAVCESPGTTTHSANCDFPVGSSDLTDRGSYTGASPNGTYDQGGNVFEWTEGLSSGNRVLRGGSFLSPSAQLAAASRSAGNPGDAFKEVGFRVATSVIPEPGSGLLVMTGVLGLAGWRRRRA